MFLNTIQPAEGATHAQRRVGRGIGSGLAGGYHKVGFEGGQMPLQRRLPKRGFKSVTAKFNAQITLSELNSIAVDEVDVLTLKQAGLIAANAEVVKVISSGNLNKAVVLKGIKATKGAKIAIEAAGGKVEE